MRSFHRHRRPALLSPRKKKISPATLAKKKSKKKKKSIDALQREELRVDAEPRSFRMRRCPDPGLADLRRVLRRRSQQSGRTGRSGERAVGAGGEPVPAALRPDPEPRPHRAGGGEFREVDSGSGGQRACAR